MIDTAAEKSGITTSIAQALAAQPVGRNRIRTTAGLIDRPVYAVTVTVGWDLALPADPIDVDVLEVDIAEADMLIGRDVLSRGELVWYGPDARFGLVLPRGGGQLR
jgi:hypothetical protein